MDPIGQWSTGNVNYYSANIRDDLTVGEDITIGDDLTIADDLTVGGTTTSDIVIATSNLNIPVSDTQLLYSDTGNVVGSSNLTFNDSTNTFSTLNILAVDAEIQDILTNDLEVYNTGTTESSLRLTNDSTEEKIESNSGELELTDSSGTYNLTKLWNRSDTNTLTRVQVSDGVGGFNSFAGFNFDESLDSSGRLSVSGAILSPSFWIGNTGNEITQLGGDMTLMDTNAGTKTLSELAENWPSDGVATRVQISDGANGFTSYSGLTYNDAGTSYKLLVNTGILTTKINFGSTSLTIEKAINDLVFKDITTGEKTLAELAENYPASGTGGKIQIADGSGSFTSSSNLFYTSDTLRTENGRVDADLFFGDADDTVLITRDVSDKLSFTDATAGTKTLSDLADNYPAYGIAGSIQMSNGDGTFDNSPNLNWSDADTRLTVGGSTLTPRLYIANLAQYLSQSGTDLVFTDGNAGSVTLSTLATSYPANGSTNEVQLSDGASGFTSSANLTYNTTSDLLTTEDLRINGKVYLGADATSYIREVAEELQFVDATAGAKTLEDLAENTYYASSGASGLIQYSDGSSGFSGEAGFSYNSSTNTMTVSDISATSSITVDGDLEVSGTGNSLTIEDPLNSSSTVDPNTKQLLMWSPTSGIIYAMDDIDTGSGSTVYFDTTEDTIVRSSSSIRYKNLLDESDAMVESRKVLELPVRSYEYKNKIGIMHRGVIAEDAYNISSRYAVLGAYNDEKITEEDWSEYVIDKIGDKNLVVDDIFVREITMDMLCVIQSQENQITILTNNFRTLQDNYETLQADFKNLLSRIEALEK